MVLKLELVMLYSEPSNHDNAAPYPAPSPNGVGGVGRGWNLPSQKEGDRQLLHPSGHFAGGRTEALSASIHMPPQLLEHVVLRAHPPFAVQADHRLCSVG